VAPAVVASPAAVPKPAAAGGTPKPGGVLRRGLIGDLDTWDDLTTTRGQTVHLTQHIYSSLVRGNNDDELKLEGDVAQDWAVSPDGLKVTFNLRPNVKFHDGSPLTAEDVKFSFDRIRTPPKGMPSPRAGRLSIIEGIQATGPTTVVFNLKGPSADFVYLLTDPFYHIVSKQFTEPLDAAGEGLKNKWLGSGPFILEKAVQGEIYVLKRNPNYHHVGRPYLDEIQGFPIPQITNRIGALETGRLDHEFDLREPAIIRRLETMPQFTVQRRRFVTSEQCLFFNLTKAPFSDLRFRQAVSLAIDRAEYYRTMEQSILFREAGYGLMPSGSEWNLPKEEFAKYPGMDTFPGLGGNADANRTKARALLQELGIGPGSKFGIISPGDQTSARVPPVAIADQLKKVGIELEVEYLDPSVYAEREKKMEFELNFHAMGLAGTFPDAILGEAWTSTGPRNYSGWKNPAIDELFTKQSVEQEKAKRKELVYQMTRLHLENLYSIYLQQGDSVTVQTASLKGWSPFGATNENMSFDQAYFDK
jgi:peptide/nickel transport system substrate-binding protein